MSIGDKNKIKEIQILLRDAGFDPGPIDGIIGPKTRAAAEAYINNSRGQSELNKRRKEVGEILDQTSEQEDTQAVMSDEEGLSVSDKLENMALAAEAAIEREEDLLKLAEEEWTQDQWDSKYGKNSLTFDEVLFLVDYKPRPSTPADATSYDVDKLNAELGITNTALGSSIKRGWERAMRGNLDSDSYIKLVEDVEKARSGYKGGDKSFAQRAGAFLRTVAIQAGFVTRGTGAFLEETLGGLFNAGTDLIRPEGGGAGDAFVDALLGVDQGTDSWSKWWAEKKPGWRYDAYRNEFYDITTGEKITQEEVASTASQAVQPTGAGQGTGQPTTTKTYWGRYDTGSWGTFPLDQKPADFKWAWELPEFEGQDQELFTGDKDLENDIYPLTVDYLAPPVVDDEVVDDEVTTADTFEDTLELGTGYVANEVLNDWNNIPQGGILIDAGGQKFLGYQVPGAGQIYSEPPMYMLYQILDNDVYEAGLLTEGTPANVNVVLTSVADLNQYGLVVGGTDEITDDVEHPFIRFVENFEAGKKINPWLGDTRINPNSGVTYQQIL